MGGFHYSAAMYWCIVLQCLSCCKLLCVWCGVLFEQLLLVKMFVGLDRVRARTKTESKRIMDWMPTVSLIWYDAQCHVSQTSQHVALRGYFSTRTTRTNMLTTCSDCHA